jgi:glycosyltransferase involved in cell wall biosynthesis
MIHTDRTVSTIKVISNFYAIEGDSDQGYRFVLHEYPRNRLKWFDYLGVFAISFRYDYILLMCSSRDTVVLGLLKLFIPFNRCRLITLDMVQRRPSGIRAQVFKYMKYLAFRRVHLFMEYFKNTKAYQDLFHMNPEKLVYVPFKVNSFELILRTPVRDEGYVFCGGRSLRDFDCLAQAVRGLGIPVMIVTQSDEEIALHGSALDVSTLPENVTVVRHDGDQSTFVRLIAGCRLAVVPLKQDVISAAGISVYLMCMALHKCTILSDLPGVRDVLGDDKAIIVPAGDPVRLRSAIAQAYNDDVFRQTFADSGHRYATNLGGESKLVESVRSVIVKDFEDRL